MKNTLQHTPMRMADQFMESYRSHELYGTWHYENGCLLKALEELYARTGEQKYFDYIQSSWIILFRMTDRFVRIRWRNIIWIRSTRGNRYFSLLKKRTGKVSQSI